MSWAWSLVFSYDILVSFLISFAVVHDLLLFIAIFIIMIIFINRIFVLYVLFISIIVQGRTIAKMIKTKNNETIKATGRLNNRPTKKPYSCQVSSKTTTFNLHESSWQKQLMEAISNWTSGCDTPQKIGKTTIMKCKRNCKRKTTNEYNTYTSLAFLFCRNWMISSSSSSSILESSDSWESDPGLRINWTTCSRFSLWFMVRFWVSKKSWR